MDDTQALERLRPSGGIAAILAKSAASTAPEPRSEALDAESLPGQSDDYQAHARASNKPLTSFHCLFSNRTIENFQYGELTSRSRFVPADVEGGGNLLMLRFAGLEATEVLISGRNLRPLFDLITQHRIAWVAEIAAGRDFENDGNAVIAGIVLRPVAPGKA